MSPAQEIVQSSVFWFVGASFGGSDDQTQRFLEEGIWEVGNPTDKESALIKSMAPGDRIAIKAAYTRKKDLPFDNRGNIVSVMAIKAIGTITENPGDGSKVNIAWEKQEPQREWYFYTYRKTIWRVLPGDWATDALISFTFENKPQDYDRFRNDPFWKERFGDLVTGEHRFLWTKFYQAVADGLLAFRSRRPELVAGIHQIAGRVESLSNFQDQFADGTAGPLKDICPFTVMGIFNRGITNANRKIIAAELAKLLGVDETIPETYEGIPVLNNQKSWFFGYEKNRKPNDIDNLWELFANAVRLADAEYTDERSSFINAYDEVSQQYGVGWNITMGLYWIRPWDYPTLDSQSQTYINKKLNVQMGMNGPKHRCNAKDYLNIMDTLEARFKEQVFPVHSFPELSLEAWLYKDAKILTDDESVAADSTNNSENVVVIAPIQTYTIASIIDDGCFIELAQLKKILNSLRIKKNIILQGPPGTGKTWLAKRLAFALLGQRDDSRVRSLQFHPNLSYEDFVRGYRPNEEGRLSLIDGPFMKIIKAAFNQPTNQYVVVIEEINRGNPAQIFGEMLTLLETDKRTPNEALQLCYPRNDEEHIHIPDNLYVIGTMNIADRSIALVDLALRRRFAFINLKPIFGKAWHDWIMEKCGIDKDIIDEIEKRMLALNESISTDTSLGPQFRIGHSYVTPSFKTPISDAREWFKQVVETEIGPLLDEYWFDSLDKAQKARKQLVEGF
ncbi:MAG: hypothetical protein CSYNP_03639 [Syntrophus sp. SKADARSKE-3]|nr:hypothetical protein [Syntrophus sp. SKADARSKE-3]